MCIRSLVSSIKLQLVPILSLKELQIDDRLVTLQVGKWYLGFIQLEFLFIFNGGLMFDV